ncbi:MAG TPA: hypothetical protein VFY73_27970 [Ideonella sp.]|nr:hypothetical protein [Ideonella sp.]
MTTRHKAPWQPERSIGDPDFATANRRGCLAAAQLVDAMAAFRAGAASGEPLHDRGDWLTARALIAMPTALV